MMKTNYRIVRRIESILKDDRSEGSAFLKNALALLALGYAGVVQARSAYYQKGTSRSHRLPCRVISVGNLTLGGTGKTPMTQYLAKMLTDSGHRPVVLSRGYGGKGHKKGRVVSDGRHVGMGPASAGDEPFMMAHTLPKVPVIVGRDRLAAGQMACKRFSPDILILDDGFQHLRLIRDLDLVLLDGRKPFGNDRLFPRGTLREPVSALKRADGCILTRWRSGYGAHSGNLPEGIPVFKAMHIPQLYLPDPTVETLGPPHPPLPLAKAVSERIRKKRVYLFSGIADNQGFRDTVSELFVNTVGHIRFPDHYRYEPGEISDIFRHAMDSGAEMIVTTEKDWSRLGRRVDGPLPLAVVGVKISFGKDRDAFHEFVQSRLSRNTPTPLEE